MSEITDKIDQYVAGELAFDVLLDFLVHHKYVTAQRYSNPTSPLAEEDWDVLHVDGSFDEVTDAVPRKLTYVQYRAVIAGINAYRRPVTS